MLLLTTTVLLPEPCSNKLPRVEALKMYSTSCKFGGCASVKYTITFVWEIGEMGI